MVDLDVCGSSVERVIELSVSVIEVIGMVMEKEGVTVLPGVWFGFK